MNGPVWFPSSTQGVVAGLCRLIATREAMRDTEENRSACHQPFRIASMFIVRASGREMRYALDINTCCEVAAVSELFGTAGLSG